MPRELKGDQVWQQRGQRESILGKPRLSAGAAVVSIGRVERGRARFRPMASDVSALSERGPPIAWVISSGSSRRGLVHAPCARAAARAGQARQVHTAASREADCGGVIPVIPCGREKPKNRLNFFRAHADPSFRRARVLTAGRPHLFVGGTQEPLW